ncbi:hypothetical protein PR048_011209 [Dryococelus australis]|uniref:DDE-1 domain-containing protein n=1 Tax=Dryococelus australis TaxID=614101 RepID=A0ABQ9HKX5_9NEOP|nr:hypothetical protein PR048_011209 [Dryococelus australis]
MNEWLLGVDRKMGRQKRWVFLFMDNAASHRDTGLQLENNYTTNSAELFLKAGIPDAQGFRGFEMAVDGDSVELTELLKQFGESAVDYANVDYDVQSTDIKDLVASIQTLLPLEKMRK